MNAEISIDDDTPADRRRRKVREAIIDAAEAIFSSEGEQGISMRRLAEAIDYSPAAIYKYFSSKDDLFEAIRDLFFERLLKRIHEAMAEGGETSQLCARCVKAYIETGLEEPNHYIMAFSPSARVQPHVHSEEETAYQAESKLVSMIEKGMAEGAFRKMDPHVASKSVWASLHGLTNLMVCLDDFPSGMPGSEHVTREEVIDFHTDVIMRGLCCNA
ncbi:TetR/AcrR family transcriptional regulator [Maricaulis sp.]|uniref:TetR/AcrR family transcriptional regulator n=1 Tax=unclassified Maricaulis TaxID=2632371 RepID=UPI001AFF859E|nr:TetR/AcrR family transcriptional regulator [Maricaulis sp.]MBO6796900.1 TetR/AcrR family transcriptional regulator [Maricaulis sp.]